MNKILRICHFHFTNKVKNGTKSSPRKRQVLYIELRLVLRSLCLWSLGLSHEAVWPFSCHIDESERCKLGKGSRLAAKNLGRLHPSYPVPPWVAHENGEGSRQSFSLADCPCWKSALFSALLTKRLLPSAAASNSWSYLPNILLSQGPSSTAVFPELGKTVHREQILQASSHSYSLPVSFTVPGKTKPATPTPCVHVGVFVRVWLLVIICVSMCISILHNSLKLGDPI